MIGGVTPPTADALDMWVVYRRPRDYPDKFVARLWSGDAASVDHFAIADTLGEIQAALIAAGRVRWDRMPRDDAVIVEVWL